MTTKMLVIHNSSNRVIFEKYIKGSLTRTIVKVNNLS